MNMKLQSKYCYKTLSRFNHTLPVNAIRNRFLEYFIKENNHNFIKSCPVTPYFDSSIPFINAGMCQFKKVFTGEEELECTSVANTQKCIRVGGQHDDLSVVGIDSYHHTFFEMLGNWSFGSYSKKEACKLAWELLTSHPYKVPAHRLYVTYFSGDTHLNLPADTEVREIWLELGISPGRILPFSSKDNFWDMGITGPCGTCTEIHIALTDEFSFTPHLVNKNNPLLTELWNLVFIRYDRINDTTVELLPKEYIDTGMGFERLVTVLQRKTSSYDTDLFAPLFGAISKNCKTPEYKGTFDSDNLDSSYRQLADFSRMITVAISDNVYPEENGKLRHVLRKALYIAEEKFGHQSPQELIIELSKNVAETLDEVFPEIGNNLKQVISVVKNESELLRKQRKQYKEKWEQIKLEYPVFYPILKDMAFIEYPNVPFAYEYLQKHISSSGSDNMLPSKKTQLLYHQFGLERGIIEKLLLKCGLETNWEEVEQLLKAQKLGTKKPKYSTSGSLSTLLRLGIKTDDSAKYAFERNACSGEQMYTFPDLAASIVALLTETQIVSVIKCENFKDLKSVVNVDVNINNKEIGLVFDKTNFYSEAGGQCSDKGRVIVTNEQQEIKLKVNRIHEFENIVIHHAKLEEENSDRDVSIRAGNGALLKIDGNHRLKTMRNHTASHLLTSSVKEQFAVSYYKGGFVNAERFESVYGIFGKKLFREECAAVEETLKKNVSDKLPVHTTIISNSVQLLQLPNISFTPGDTYPHGTFRVITVTGEDDTITSRELCCGTHVENTADIGNICITKMKKSSSWKLNIVGVTGRKVDVVTKNTKEIENKMKEFTEVTDDIINSDEDSEPEKVFDVSVNLTNCINELHYNQIKFDDMYHYSIGTHEETLKSFRNIISKLTEEWSRETLIEIITRKLKETMEKKYAIYFCALHHDFLSDSSFIFDLVSRNSVPTLFFSHVYEIFQCACYVPNDYCSEHFDARSWLLSILNVTKTSYLLDNEDCSKNFCRLKPSRVITFHFIDTINLFMESAECIALEQIH